MKARKVETVSNVREEQMTVCRCVSCDTPYLAREPAERCCRCPECGSVLDETERKKERWRRRCGACARKEELSTARGHLSAVKRQLKSEEDRHATRMAELRGTLTAAEGNLAVLLRKGELT